MRGQMSTDGWVASLRRAARSGRAAGPLLLLVAGAALLLVAWLSFGRNDGARSKEPSAPARNEGDESPAAPALPRPAAAANEAMSIEPVLGIGRSTQLPRPEPKPFDESRLEGRGLIRGFVQAPPGIEFPMEWILIVEPSSMLIGADRAERRRLEFHAGERDFEISGLSLGGYMLRASAFGMATEQQHLLLARPHETELYVQMQLLPTAFVDGRVSQPDSTPAIGLELALEPKPAGVRVFTISDHYGHFLFSDVQAGAYTLHFGRAENPVREPIDVVVGTSPTRLPDCIVPPLEELIVRVLSAPGEAAVGVQLDGYGSNGGRISGKTNQDGEYRARFLPAGRYTIDATAADGRRARARKIVEVGELGLIELVLEK